MPLFVRECRLVLGDREVRGFSRARSGAMAPGLSVSFRVERALKRQPGTAEIQVINLSEETRKYLHGLKDVPVKLEAGYLGATAAIFTGTLRRVESTWEAPNWLTVVRSGDGEKALRTARVAASFDGKVSLTDVINAASKAMGVGIGNAAKMASKGRFVSGSNAFLQGAVLSGLARDELERVLSSAGLEWSVQDNELQILERGKPLSQQAVLLSKTSGLVGSPTVDSKGEVSFRSLMNAEITPGRLAVIDSAQLKSTIRVSEAVYIGDTASTSDWYIDGKGKAA